MSIRHRRPAWVSRNRKSPERMRRKGERALQGGRAVAAMLGASVDAYRTGMAAAAMRLSPGEHVLTAAEVEAMGGQHAVYAFRAALDSDYARVYRLVTEAGLEGADADTAIRTFLARAAIGPGKASLAHWVSYARSATASSTKYEKDLFLSQWLGQDAVRVGLVLVERYTGRG